MRNKADDFWSKRYQEEREIWLDEPSLTAKFLAKIVPSEANVFEVGYGYGRDAFYLADKGYYIQGMEQSPEGFRMAQERLQANPLTKTPIFLLGDFLQANLQGQIFDAVYSHRVAHLFVQQDQIERYVEQVAAILKKDGYLLTSARDPRGQKPTRLGHNLHHWNEQRFITSFGKHFRIESFLQGQEIESVSNPVPTFFTLMLARKRLVP